MAVKVRVQWGEGWGSVPVGVCLFPLTGAQVPITSYTCTKPNLAGFLDHRQCTVSNGLRNCQTEEGARPTLLSSSADPGVYAWDNGVPPYPNPFVVLDIPQGWCVGSVKMTFVAQSSIPTLSLSVHSAERLSTNTDKTMFSMIISNVGTRLVVMNLPTLAHGKYLRINMTSTGRLYLKEIKVFGTSRYTFTDTRNLHDMLTPLLTSLSLSSVTDDSICTHPSSAGGDPASPTTSVALSTYEVTPFLSPSPTPSGISVAPDSPVLPAAISVVAVLLVVVLTAMFGVIICIITHRHKTRKSLDMQCHSIHYRSTQSDVALKDNQLHPDLNAAVPIHDANDTIVENHNADIRGAPRNYADLGPSESNDSVFQGAAQEPVAEGAISRPTSQASIHSNEVPTKPTHGMVPRVHPSMLDHSYNSCYWENITAGTDESGHYETSLHWQHAGGPYYNLSDCQLPGEGAARDDRHRVLKDPKAQIGTNTHHPPTLTPPSALPIAADSAYANPILASEKKREPSLSSPTYANIDPPSSSSMRAATRRSKQHSSHPKTSYSAKIPRVPQEDHIDKTSASSTSFPLPRLTS